MGYEINNSKSNKQIFKDNFSSIPNHYLSNYFIFNYLVGNCVKLK